MITTVDHKSFLSDNFYSVGKKVVQVILPAIGSLYFGLSSIWGFPYTEKILGTLALIETFLGIVLGLSSIQFDKSGALYDGTMVITKPENGPRLFSMEIEGDPVELIDKKSVTFKVDASQLPA